MQSATNTMHDYDHTFMRRCIELAQDAVDRGDAAFGSLVAMDDKLIAEASNEYKSKITDHAEIVALNRAHTILGTRDLSSCTLYTSCEPCPMCAFMIREFKIKRVVFALPSLYMGGYSKWSILQDEGLAAFKPIFSDPPEVCSGFMETEAKAVMDQTALWMFGSNALSVAPVDQSILENFHEQRQG
jgi:tRNA(adenine34) deaminase